MTWKWKCKLSEWSNDKQRQRLAKQRKHSPAQQNLDKAMETLQTKVSKAEQVSPLCLLISVVQISTQERLCVHARLKSQVTAAGGGSTNTAFSKMTFAEPHHVKSPPALKRFQFRSRLAKGYLLHYDQQIPKGDIFHSKNAFKWDRGHLK